jgi:hypothetical protein
VPSHSKRSVAVQTEISLKPRMVLHAPGETRQQPRI